MSVTFCFWALLSLENFEFVYLPSFIKDTEIAVGITVGNVLQSHSLLEFIHPDELSLATTDLLNFVRIKTLAGAITRCRLRRIKSLVSSDSLKDEDWKVTDVVMYTAANKTILTFFHTHQVEPENTSTFTPTPYRSSCYYNTPLNENEAAIISETLQKHSLPLTINDPFRLFQIYNTADKKLLLQWPTYSTFIQHLDNFSSNIDSNTDRENCFDSIVQYATNLSIEEIDRQTQNTQFRSGTDCTHHSHSNSVAFLAPCGVCQIEKIIITYGSLTFSSFQVTPIDNQFYHQHLNRIPPPPPSSTSNHTDKHMTNQSTTNSNYEKFMKSFMGDTTTTTTTSSSSSSPPLSTSATTSSPKKTEIKEEKKPSSKSSSSSSSNKVTLPKAWKSRFGITEKKCENCSTNKSPEWRRGPTGHKTLCNACGLRYARLVAKEEKKKSKSP